MNDPVRFGSVWHCPEIDRTWVIGGRSDVFDQLTLHVVWNPNTDDEYVGKTDINVPLKNFCDRIGQGRILLAMEGPDPDPRWRNLT